MKPIDEPLDCVPLQVTLAEDHSGSASYVAPPATVDMYLHQNFKSCRRYMEQAGHDLLASSRKLRLTGYVAYLVVLSMSPESSLLLARADLFALLP